MSEFEDLLETRKVDYASHISTMHVDPAIVAWAGRMQEREGSATVKVWHNTLNWIEALLVVRYGEAVEHWPAATSIADWGRALDWENGKEIPEAVVKAPELVPPE